MTVRADLPMEDVLNGYGTVKPNLYATQFGIGFTNLFNSKCEYPVLE